MKISLNWIKEFVNLPEDITPDKILYDLTMSTVEVEGYEDKSTSLNYMYIGVVKEIIKHPDADQLKITKTDLGPELGMKEIVCGGSNLYEGMATIVAIPGAQVHWHGEDKVTKIKLSKIRGVESFGMICAASEIRLANIFPSNDEKEIIDLKDSAAIAGTSAAKYLSFNDFIFDIDNKSLTNRPDLWGHYGIARELSAIYNCELKSLCADFNSLAISKDSSIKITIDDLSDCQRFFITSIDNIKVADSPLWLKVRLGLIGQKSINNIVDITNYVMFTTGKPTHAFDSNISGSDFTIRKAKNSEKLTLLDDKEIKLSETDLIISGKKDLLGLAGIMGGLNSGVNKNTTKIYFESANFCKSLIRKTMQRHAIRSDAGIRFEKGLTTNLTSQSQVLLLETLKKIIPEANIIGYQDVIGEKTKKEQIKVSHDFIVNRIGQDISSSKIQTILSALGFGVTINTETINNELYYIEVPDYRSTGDVSIPEDIVEEVARIIGYDNLKEKSIPVLLSKAVFQEDKIKEIKIREFLVQTCNSQEVVSYPWMVERNYKALNITDNSPSLDDAPSPEERKLRTKILPNLLNQVQGNLRFYSSFSIFELGRIFNNEISSEYSSDSENLPSQEKQLCIAEVNRNPEVAFFELKEKIENLLKYLNINFNFEVATNSKDYLDIKASLEIKSANIEIGAVGLLAFKSLKKLGLVKTSIAIAELNITKLLSIKPIKIKYKPLLKFPSIDYELAVILDQNKLWEDVQSTVLKSDKLIKNIEFVDQYQGEQIEKGKKSLSFKMTLLDENKTLTAKNAEKVARKVLDNLENDLSAKLRS